MSKYMGQIMAECDCQHQACETRGYCMATRIEELEDKLANAALSLDELMDLNDTGGSFGGEIYRDRLERAWAQARATLAEIKGTTK